MRAIFTTVLLIFACTIAQAQEVTGGKADQRPLYQPTVNSATKADKASSVFRKNSAAPALKKEPAQQPWEFRNYAPIGESTGIMQA